MSNPYDAVVVGASLGGCTAATLLARHGARVALVERSPEPAHYKTACTHFLQASATATLHRLGVAERLEAAGAVRGTGSSWSRFGWAHLHSDEPGLEFNYNLRRQKLDPILRDLAAAEPGVDLLLGTTVTGLLDGEDGRVGGVRTRGPAAVQQELRAQVVVGADGRDSRVARMAGIRGRVLPHERFGYFAYYRGIALEGGGADAKVWFLEPDVLYAFPEDDGLTLMAAFLAEDRLPWFKRDIEGNFEALFDGVPGAPDVRAAERTSPFIGRLSLPNVRRPAARGRVALVGDAAQASDPVWGVGCGWALQSGEWLADAVGPALAGGGDVDAALRRYAAEHRSRLLGHHLMTSSFSRARRFNAIDRMMFDGAAKDPLTARRLHRVAARSRDPLHLFTPRVLGRATAVRVTRRPLEPAALGGVWADGGEPLPADVRQERMTVARISTRVLSAGPTDAREAVVFVHGNPGSSHDWIDLVSRAGGAGIRAVALDFPGFGRAGKPDTFDHSVAGYAEWLDAALARLGIERAHLVLHDFGGPWGLGWATAHPERTASLVLVNTGALAGYRWHALARIWRTPVAGEAFSATMTRPGFHAVVARGNPRGLPRAFVDRMYDEADRGTRRAVLRLYRATPASLLEEQARAAAAALGDVPALVVWGAADPYLPVALAERQREVFPRAEVAVLPESGHWPFADDPEGVARLVIPFLRRQVTASDRADGSQATSRRFSRSAPTTAVTSASGS